MSSTDHQSATTEQSGQPAAVDQCRSSTRSNSIPTGDQLIDQQQQTQSEENAMIGGVKKEEGGLVAGNEEMLADAAHLEVGPDGNAPKEEELALANNSEAYVQLQLKKKPSQHKTKRALSTQRMSKHGAARSTVRHQQVAMPPPSIRIHRVYRNTEGVEIKQSEVIHDPALIELYLKMHTLCGRRQLWDYAFDEPRAQKVALKMTVNFGTNPFTNHLFASAQDFLAMKRRIKQRYAYHAKKQAREEAQKRKQQLKEKEEKEKDIADLNVDVTSQNKNDQQDQQKQIIPPPLPNEPGPSAASSLFRPSPSSSGYSTTSSGTAPQQTEMAKEKGDSEDAAKVTGTKRRPNAGRKRHFSPDWEGRKPDKRSIR